MNITSNLPAEDAGEEKVPTKFDAKTAKAIADATGCGYRLEYLSLGGGQAILLRFNEDEDLIGTV